MILLSNRAFDVMECSLVLGGIAKAVMTIFMVSEQVGQALR